MERSRTHAGSNDTLETVVRGLVASKRVGDGAGTAAARRRSRVQTSEFAALNLPVGVLH
jgi:hypothetical protein